MNPTAERQSLRGRWRQWCLDRRYPVPEQWTVGEMTRLARLKLTELEIALSGSRAFLLTPGAEQLFADLHELDADLLCHSGLAEPDQSTIDRWMYLRERRLVRGRFDTHVPKAPPALRSRRAMRNTNEGEA